jgi:hypothetical protein
MPQQTNPNDVMSFVNQLRDRDMMDYKNKANFMADLQLRQEQRMRQLYDPSKENVNTALAPGAMAGTVPSAFPIGDQAAGAPMSQKDKAELELKKTQGQEALDIKSKQEALNQQKSDQINALKTADLEQKVNTSAQHIAYLNQQLTDRTKTADEQMQLHRDLAAAVEERHKLEIARMQHNFDIASQQHNRALDQADERIKASQNVQTTTTIDPTGQTKTTRTLRGPAAEGFQSTRPQQQPDGSWLVTDHNGDKHIIPSDKIDDWNQNYQPQIDQMRQGGGGQDQDQPQGNGGNGGNGGS